MLKASITRFCDCKLKIGLLGGSFNPAHAGHINISNTVRKALQLDQIWWLVSPQNPLKSTDDMMSFEARYQSAENLIKHNKIIVSDIEKVFKTRYTIDTIKKLKQRFPHIDFVWIIGADNLVNFHKWKNWQQIFALIKVIVYDRGTYSYKALSSITANKFNYAKIKAGGLAEAHPPSWSFLRMKIHPHSATLIRTTKKNLI